MALGRPGDKSVCRDAGSQRGPGNGSQRQSLAKALAGLPQLPDVPVTSNGRFFRAVTTGPSFLRNKGLLRLSATFCFSLDRNFRLGSEAAQKGIVIIVRHSQRGSS